MRILRWRVGTRGCRGYLAYTCLGLQYGSKSLTDPVHQIPEVQLAEWLHLLPPSGISMSQSFIFPPLVVLIFQAGIVLILCPYQTATGHEQAVRSDALPVCAWTLTDDSLEAHICCIFFTDRSGVGGIFASAVSSQDALHVRRETMCMPTCVWKHCSCSAADVHRWWWSRREEVRARGFWARGSKRCRERGLAVWRKHLVFSPLPSPP